MTCGRSVTVTLAPSVAAATMPTRPVPEPSSRTLRGRPFGTSDKAERVRESGLEPG